MASAASIRPGSGQLVTSATCAAGLHRAARCRPLVWTFTSTVRRLRDQATWALDWFGRVDPEGLFALTIDSLRVNDAHVGERMLAAAYGVLMSHQQLDAGFAALLGPFLEQLASLVGQSATAPTHHYLVRLYARGIVAFAAKFSPATLPASLRGAWAFATPAQSRLSPKATQEPTKQGGRSTWTSRTTRWGDCSTIAGTTT